MEKKILDVCYLTVFVVISSSVLKVSQRTAGWFHTVWRRIKNFTPTVPVAVFSDLLEADGLARHHWSGGMLLDELKFSWSPSTVESKSWDSWSPPEASLAPEVSLTDLWQSDFLNGKWFRFVKMHLTCEIWVLMIPTYSLSWPRASMSARNCLLSSISRSTAEKNHI